MPTKALLASAVTLVLTGAACGGDETPAPGPMPSSSLQTLAPGQLPTSSPGAATGTVTSGSATIELGGGLHGTVRLTMLAPPALYSPPPGSTAVVWTDGEQSMGITGMSFEGGRDTSDTLSLRLELRDGSKAVVLTSSARECKITVDTAAVGSLAGTFDCADLSGGAAADALSVDATGTFTASG